MKKEYSKPTIEIIKINITDVITESLGSDLAGDVKKPYNEIF